MNKLVIEAIKGFISHIKPGSDPKQLYSNISKDPVAIQVSKEMK